MRIRLILMLSIGVFVFTNSYNSTLASYRLQSKNERICDSLIRNISQSKPRGKSGSELIKQLCSKQKLLDTAGQISDTTAKMILYLYADDIEPLTETQANKVFQLFPNQKKSFWKFRFDETEIDFLFKMFRRGYAESFEALIRVRPFTDGSASEAYAGWQDILDSKGELLIELLSKHDDKIMDMVTEDLYDNIPYDDLLILTQGSYNLVSRINEATKGLLPLIFRSSRFTVRSSSSIVFGQ